MGLITVSALPEARWSWWWKHSALCRLMICHSAKNKLSLHTFWVCCRHSGCCRGGHQCGSIYHRPWASESSVNSELLADGATGKTESYLLSLSTSGRDGFQEHTRSQKSLIVETNKSLSWHVCLIGRHALCVYQKNLESGLNNPMWYLSARSTIKENKRSQDYRFVQEYRAHLTCQRVSSAAGP